MPVLPDGQVGGCRGFVDRLCLTTSPQRPPRLPTGVSPSACRASLALTCGGGCCAPWTTFGCPQRLRPPLPLIDQMQGSRAPGGAQGAQPQGVWGRAAPQPWSRHRRRAGRRGEQQAEGRHCLSSTPLVGGLILGFLREAANNIAQQCVVSPHP